MVANNVSSYFIYVSPKPTMQAVWRHFFTGLYYVILYIHIYIYTHIPKLSKTVVTYVQEAVKWGSKPSYRLPSGNQTYGNGQFPPFVDVIFPLNPSIYRGVPS